MSLVEGFAVAMGLGAFLTAYPALVSAIGLLGGAYLLHIGLKTLRAAWEGTPGTLVASSAMHSDGGNWQRGFLIVATNPKAAMMGALGALVIYSAYARLFSTGIAFGAMGAGLVLLGLRSVRES